MTTYTQDDSSHDLESVDQSPRRSLAIECLHASDDGMYALDRKWRILDMNQAAADYFQQPREELLGRDILDAFPLARGTDLEKALRSVMAGGQAVRLETRSPSWPERHALIKVFPTSQGVGVWFRNVTRERTEEQARLAELEAIYQSAPVGLAMLDRDLRYLRCNERLAEINGVPAVEHLGRRVRDVVPSLADTLESVFRRALDTGEPSVDREVSGMVRSRPNEIRTWVENVCPMRNDRGEVVAILVTVQEITVRKQAEAALAESEAKLRAAQELSLDGFMILRANRNANGDVEDFTFEFANEVARQFAPAVDANPTNKRLLAAMPQLRDHPQVFPRYVRLLAEQGRGEAVVKYDRGGERRWLRDAAVVLDHDRIAVSFQDITRQHRAEHQLRLVIRELEHRRKNTLTLIQGMMRVTLRSSANMSEFEQAFTRRLRVMADAQSLITHSESGSIPLQDIVTGALAPFRQPGLRIETGPRVELPANTAVHLTLALHELATNAVKYGALSQEEGVASFSWTQKGDRVEIVWRETGGPKVTPPQRKGLGVPLVAAALTGVRGATILHEFLPQGVVCHMSYAAGSADRRPLSKH